MNEAKSIFDSIGKANESSELMKNIIESPGIIYDKKSGTYIGFLVMTSKSYYPLYFIVLFIFIQCDVKDESPISFRIDNGNYHFQHENIHLIFDDQMYCQVRFDVDVMDQSITHDK